MAHEQLERLYPMHLLPELPDASPGTGDTDTGDTDASIRTCRCGRGPVYVSSSGKRYHTCIQCRRDEHRAWRARQVKRSTDTPTPASASEGETIRATDGASPSSAMEHTDTGEGVRLCVRCGERERYVSPLSGREYATCLPCKRADNKRWRIEREARDATTSAPPTDGRMSGGELAGRDGRDDPREYEDDTREHEDDTDTGDTGDTYRELAPVDVPEAPAVGEMERSIATGANGERLTPRASDVPGVLADMLLLLDRSREAIGRGEIDALRVAVDVRGVRVHMGTESIERRGHSDNED